MNEAKVKRRPGRAMVLAAAAALLAACGGTLTRHEPGTEPQGGTPLLGGLFELHTPASQGTGGGSMPAAAAAPAAGNPLRGSELGASSRSTDFLALGDDGSLWRWRTGSAPRQVNGMGAIAELAAGLQTVLLRLSDGTVWDVSGAAPAPVPGINLN